MAILQKINDFRRAVFQAEHEFKSVGGDSFQFTLTNSYSISWALATDLPADVDHQFLASRALPIVSTPDSGTEFDVVMQDQNILSIGGATGPFQYLWMVNVTQGGLVAGWDYGSPQTVIDGQELVINFTDINNRLLSFL